MPRFFILVFDYKLTVVTVAATAVTTSAITATTTVAPITAFRRTLVKFLSALTLPALILAAPARVALRAGNMRAAHMLIGRTSPVAGCERDFEFDDFIPLRICALPFGN